MNHHRRMRSELIVASMAHSRDFYRDVLGATVEAEEPAVVHLRLGDGRIVLREGLRPAPQPTDPRSIVDGVRVFREGVDYPLWLATDDLERDVALLRSRGAELRPVPRDPASVALRDPDGNSIEIGLMSPSALTWGQATDRSRGLELRDAEALARGILAEELPHVPEEEGRSRSDAQHTIEKRITRALVARFGIWAAGWCWGRDYEGGPIVGWCCAIDSMTTVDETAARAREALREWHEWIEHLSRAFAGLREHATVEVHPEEKVSRGAARLVSEVVERTGYNGAWYGHAIQVLSWYLESMGLPLSRAREIAETTAEGRFNSWSEPDAAVIAEAAAALARASAADLAGASGDALEAWLRTRAAVDWASVPGLQPDALETLYQEDFVRLGRYRPDAEREALRHAFERARADGRSRAPLTWELIAGWQAELLGTPATFRTGTAFAKEGRERYGLAPDTETRYRQALIEAVDPAVPLPARAARLYLDTCFFHPFPDGNGRAALLLVEYLLRREGLGLGDARPLVLPPRWADDVEGARLLPGTIASLMRKPWKPPGGQA